jgi:hypothetical protein
MKRKCNPAWVKGKSPNPKGRPKGKGKEPAKPTIASLFMEEAMRLTKCEGEDVEVQRIARVIRKAFDGAEEGDKKMIDLIFKSIPTQGKELDQARDIPIKTIVKHKPGRKPAAEIIDVIDDEQVSEAVSGS